MTTAGETANGTLKATAPVATHRLREDVKCSPGALAAGLAVSNEVFYAGNLCAGIYTA